MREILFRGKRLDNSEWVEGNLFIPDKVTRTDAPTEILMGTNIVRISFDVDPSTVGQYTGLTDKNGKRIFEGDMVRDSCGDMFEVFYNGKHCSFLGQYKNAKDPAKNGCYRLGDCCSLAIEVTGSIHDNLELINEVQGICPPGREPGPYGRYA